MKLKWMTARVQFSLRFLLISTVLLGLWLGWTVRRTREQKQAVACVRAHHGEVHYDYQWAPAPSNSTGADTWLGGEYDGKIAKPRNWFADRLGDDLIHRAESVQFVSSDWPQSTVTELGRLDGLPHLKTLALQGRHVGDETLEQIANLRQLETLVLHGGGYSNEGLKRITALTKIKILMLTGGSITDDGLASLASMRRLETLGLLDLPIEGDGLKHLEQLPNLQNLVLMSGAGRPAIDAVKSLCRLKELIWIDASGSGGPNADLLNELQTALPTCKIVVN